ncbi:MAG: hypothetical protein PHE83_13810 [Opitutaceae bacterium]|nr:hypothetical protein [Opitutaceae bacterium]
MHRFVLVMALANLVGAAPKGKNAASEPPAPGATIAPANEPAPPAATISADQTAAPAVANPDRSAAPKPRPRLSPAITGLISSSVPAWKAPPPESVEKAPSPPPADPDVVKMAPVIVNSNRLPRVDEKEWLTPKARDDVLVKEYLSDFDRVLNYYTLPIVGISKEARARMMYEEDKRLQDLKWINDQIDQSMLTDPAAAKELMKVRDDTFTREEP